MNVRAIRGCVAKHTTNPSALQQLAYPLCSAAARNNLTANKAHRFLVLSLQPTAIDALSGQYTLQAAVCRGRPQPSRTTFPHLAPIDEFTNTQYCYLWPYRTYAFQQCPRFPSKEAFAQHRENKSQSEMIWQHKVRSYAERTMWYALHASIAQDAYHVA